MTIQPNPHAMKSGDDLKIEQLDLPLSSVKGWIIRKLLDVFGPGMIENEITEEKLRHWMKLGIGELRLLALNKSSKVGLSFVDSLEEALKSFLYPEE